jgi:hypothetical protein
MDLTYVNQFVMHNEADGMVTLFFDAIQPAIKAIESDGTVCLEQTPKNVATLVITRAFAENMAKAILATPDQTEEDGDILAAKSGD